MARPYLDISLREKKVKLHCSVNAVEGGHSFAFFKNVFNRGNSFSVESSASNFSAIKVLFTADTTSANEIFVSFPFEGEKKRISFHYYVVSLKKRALQ